MPIWRIVVWAIIFVSTVYVCFQIGEIIQNVHPALPDVQRVLGGPDQVIVYVSVGNSDDKLTQAQWSAFYRDVDRLLEPGYLVRRHGRWLSAPDDEYQNACWLIEIDPDLPVVPRTGLPEMPLLTWLHGELSRLAQIWRQDSIAWAQAPVTEFIKPRPNPANTPPLSLEDPT